MCQRIVGCFLSPPKWQGRGRGGRGRGRGAARASKETLDADMDTFRRKTTDGLDAEMDEYAKQQPAAAAAAPAGATQA